MVTKVNVGDKGYEIPEMLTVEQFTAIQLFGWDNQKAIKLICATVLGAPLNAFNNIEEGDLTTLLSLCLVPLIGLGEEKGVTAPPHLDLDKLAFGEFCDLDVVSHRGLKHNLAELISILFETPIDTVLDSPINGYWKGVEDWLAFRTEIYQKYSTFFDIQENDPQREGGESEGLDAARVWYYAMAALANDDFLKIHQVAERPVIEALNWLSYLKDKRYKERQEQKRQLAINKRK